MIKNSIRNKLIVLLLLITIIPFGTSIIITYFHTKEFLKNQAVEENSKLLYQGKINLESYMNELNGLTLSLYNNPGFLNFLRSSKDEDNYLTIGIMKNVVQTILYAGDTINRVQIAFADEDRVISASRRSTVVFMKGRSAKSAEAFNRARDSSSHMYIEPLMEQTNSRNIMAVHRAFTNIPSDNVLAYITLEIAPDDIVNLSRNLYTPGSEEFYIVSQDGLLIYSSDKDAASGQVPEKWVDAIVSSGNKAGTLEWKKDDFSGMMIYEQMEESAGGWFLVKRVPDTTLYESAFSVAKINILFGIIGLTLVILATLFVSFKITSPIRVLLRSISQVERGDMNVEYDSFGKDEIGILGMRFNEMIEKINHLINREYKLEIENKTNQLKVLQSQINPHFLYNALQSIGTVALKNKVPQIYTLITHLSKIMRYGMDMEEDRVPLIKEINYTKAFLLLQKERFGEKFIYRIDAGEEVSSVKVPKMLLQPVIENYFKHGFTPGEGTGELNIECNKDSGFLCIDISDNGGGADDGRLGDIWRCIKGGPLEAKGDSTSIGLRNVYGRLMLYYGEEAILQLGNRGGKGFIVSMKLPLHPGGEVDEGNHHR
ncbi:histidine kinase [Bacillus infantis]|uniref:cache domain-containing sensor histidine kinase n=1 Tax=Bacillus infantis TaxID=324767 RepID=UPI002FBE7ED4